MQLLDQHIDIRQTRANISRISMEENEGSVRSRLLIVDVDHPSVKLDLIARRNPHILVLHTLFKWISESDGHVLRIAVLLLGYRRMVQHAFLFEVNGCHRKADEEERIKAHLQDEVD